MYNVKVGNYFYRFLSFQIAFEKNHGTPGTT